MSALAVSLLVLGALDDGAPPSLPTNAVGRESIDAVAAVVERRVVTMSEVRAEARLALLERAGADVAAGDIDQELQRLVLDSVVLQELLALEARRTGLAVREVDIDKSVASVRARLGEDLEGTFFQRFGIDEELLRSRARRDLAAQALLHKAFADIAVSDAEATALAPLGSAPGDVAAARAHLERERKDARLHALVDSIRRVTEVRVVWRP